MMTTVFTVDGMSCEHCVRAVTQAVEALAGVTRVSVSLSGKTVAVEHDAAQASADAIRLQIEEQGYDVTGGG
jgi:copper chaperone